MNWRDYFTQIIELRDKGFTYHEIVKELKIPLLSVTKACKAGDRVGNFVTDKKVKLVLETYQEHKTIRATNRITGISRDTIRNIINNNGVYKKPKKSISASQSVINWRKRTKQKLVEYKGGCCQVPGCGYNKCMDALTFHHLDPSQKDFQISGKSWSYERLRQEVDKCILLCSNCHKEVHAGILIPSKFQLELVNLTEFVDISMDNSWVRIILVEKE